MTFSVNFSNNCFSKEPTNFEFLTSLADSLLESATKEYVSDVEKRAIVRSLDVNDKANWFIENRLVEVLKRNGVRTIYLALENDVQPEIEPDSLVSILEFKLLHLKIEYHELTKQQNSGEKIQRVGKAGLFLRIINKPSGKILWSDNLEGTKSDWIPINNKSIVENKEIHFTKGKTIRKSNSIKLVQPLIISSAAGVIVYLFYSLRSR